MTSECARYEVLPMWEEVQSVWGVEDVSSLLAPRDPEDQVSGLRLLQS